MNPCWVFDLAFTTFDGGWGWVAGTSFAAPHVSGAAALLIGQNGGSMHPAQVAASLLRSSDPVEKDQGKDRFGHGVPSVLELLR